MATEKVTIRSQFEAVKAVLLAQGETELADFIDGRIAQTIKKNSVERKPTAKQLENEGFKSDILAWMEPDTLYAAGDIMGRSCSRECWSVDQPCFGSDDSAERRWGCHCDG